jgi:hypothetical protein
MTGVGRFSRERTETTVPQSRNAKFQIPNSRGYGENESSLGESLRAAKKLTDGGTELNTPGLFSVTSVVGLFSGREDLSLMHAYTQEAREGLGGEMAFRTRETIEGRAVLPAGYCLLPTII